jgi:hypothetical protein
MATNTIEELGHALTIFSTGMSRFHQYFLKFFVFHDRIFSFSYIVLRMPAARQNCEQAAASLLSLLVPPSGHMHNETPLF